MLSEKVWASALHPRGCGRQQPLRLYVEGPSCTGLGAAGNRALSSHFPLEAGCLENARPWIAQKELEVESSDKLELQWRWNDCQGRCLGWQEGGLPTHSFKCVGWAGYTAWTVNNTNLENPKREARVMRSGEG